jgi:hypothetical protein
MNPSRDMLMSKITLLIAASRVAGFRPYGDHVDHSKRFGAG